MQLQPFVAAKLGEQGSAYVSDIVDLLRLDRDLGLGSPARFAAAVEACLRAVAEDKPLVIALDNLEPVRANVQAAVMSLMKESEQALQAT